MDANLCSVVGRPTSSYAVQLYNSNTKPAQPVCSALTGMTGVAVTDLALPSSAVACADLMALSVWSA